jgi:hypothetical protein
MSKLKEALRLKFKSPQEAIRALGLSPSLIEPAKLACDEDIDAFKRLFIRLTKGRKP